jgi:hypothetical protein
MFVARHGLVVTVSEREPSLIYPPAAAFSLGRLNLTSPSEQRLRALRWPALPGNLIARKSPRTSGLPRLAVPRGGALPRTKAAETVLACLRYSPVHMIRLTEERQTVPYVWVHPDEER